MEAVLNAKRQMSNYDEVFLQRYDSIYKWGMLLTKHDHQLAEDLVHDVYIRFLAARTDLADVNCFDSYFYIALRNSYISYLRRITQQQKKRTEIIEFDLVENALLMTDMQHQLEVRESLRVICEYACLRKKTSISASVLILRFFHGYLPSEVAQILKSTRNAVEVHLVLARREASDYLINPSSPSFVVQSQNFNQLAKDNFRSERNTIENLRSAIFAAREGNCLEMAWLSKIYQANEMSVTRNVLSHSVSCPLCLNKLNKLLELPSLSERYFPDNLSRETVVK